MLSAHRQIWTQLLLSPSSGLITTSLLVSISFYEPNDIHILFNFTFSSATLWSSGDVQRCTLDIAEVFFHHHKCCPAWSSFIHVDSRRLSLNALHIGKKKLITFSCFIAVVTIVSKKTDVNLGVSNQLLIVLGLVLGLVISFRTSSAYERCVSSVPGFQNLIYIVPKDTRKGGKCGQTFQLCPGMWLKW